MLQRTHSTPGAAVATYARRGRGGPTISPMSEQPSSPATVVPPPADGPRPADPPTEPAREPSSADAPPIPPAGTERAPGADPDLAAGATASHATAEPFASAVLPEPPVQPRVLLHMPVDVRNLSLALLTVFAAVAMLHWASAVFIPLMLSVLLTIALQPVVDRLQRLRVPRWLGAGVLLMAIVGGIGGAAWSLSDGASELVDSVPVAARKVRDALQQRVRGPSPLDTMQRAASQIEQAATESIPPQTRRGVQRVVIERPPFNIRDYVWSGTMGLVSAAGQLTVVVFLTFFSLASGHLFRRKLMRIAGTSLERRKITMDVLDDITGQIQRYLMLQVFTSVLVGLSTWAVYAALGLENSAVWGALAGVLNLAPYIGSIAVTGASALVAFLQFGTLDMALAVGGASLVIHMLIGQLLTPWLTSRASSLSPVAVFVSVLSWGWLWGLWGLLLGIPVMMVVKAVCDRVEDLKPVGELLGH